MWDGELLLFFFSSSPLISRHSLPNANSICEQCCMGMELVAVGEWGGEGLSDYSAVDTKHAR